MAATLSNMLSLGTIAPDFLLRDVVFSNTYTFNDVKGTKGTLILFICNHCPYVKHINSKLSEIAKDYMNEGIGFAGINSNDIEKYPEDAPEKMKETAIKEDYCFPYLFDITQSVAKSYDAACTPDFFLFNEKDELVYRGQFDDARPKNDIPVTGKDLKTAMDALLAGKEISSLQKPSLGCNIKWREE